MDLTIQVSEKITVLDVVPFFEDTVYIWEYSFVGLEIITPSPSIYDSISLTESTITAISLVVSVIESQSILESVDVSNQLGGISVFDAQSGTESVVISSDNLSVSVYDTELITESLMIGIGIIVFEVVSETESLLIATQDIVVSVYNSVTVSDDISSGEAISLSIYDLASTSEIVSISEISAIISVVDTIVISEVDTPSSSVLGVNVYSQETIIEDVSLIGWDRVVGLIYDSGAILESISINQIDTQASVYDVGVITESLQVVGPTSVVYVVDTVVVGDSVSFIASFNINVLETVAVSEGIQTGNPLYIFEYAPANFDLNVWEAITIIEVIPFFEDTVYVSENVHIVVDAITGGDNIFIQESVIATISSPELSRVESIALSEGISIALEEQNISINDIITVSESFLLVVSVSVSAFSAEAITENSSVLLSLGDIDLYDTVVVSDSTVESETISISLYESCPPIEDVSIILISDVSVVDNEGSPVDVVVEIFSIKYTTGYYYPFGSISTHSMTLH